MAVLSRKSVTMEKAQVLKSVVDSAVDAAGGPTGAAYKCGCSVPTVYDWKRNGRVLQARHAILLVRAARDGGFHTTVEALAGFSAIDTEPGMRVSADPAAGSRPARGRARSRLSSSPVSDQPAALAA